MRRAARVRAHLLLAAICCAPIPSVHAQGVDDRLAPAAVQAAIHDWLTRFIGPPLQLPPDAILVTGDGDQDRVTLRADALFFGLVTADQPIATATIHPAADGSWTVDHLATPSPLKLNLHPAGGGTDIATMTLTMAEQSGHGLIDPSGRVESLFEGTWHGVDSTLDNRGGHQVQHIDSIATQSHVRPSNDGHADLMKSTDIAGYTGTRTAPDGTESHITAAHIHIAGHIDELDPARLGPALQSAIALSASIAAAIPPKDEPGRDVAAAVAKSVDQVALQHLLAALPGLISGFQLEESADTVTVGAVGQTAALAHLGIGMSANAPDGLLQTKLDVALDGLSVPSLPPAFAGLMPRHIAVRPTLSGLNLATLLRQPPPSDMAGLPADSFGPDGLVTSLDRFSMDVGPATLTGSGHVTMHHDQPTQGTASLTMSGYDALVAQIGANPMLRQAMPFFIIAKGLAHQDGGNLVWDVTYNGGITKVNGTDLSTILPGAK